MDQAISVHGIRGFASHISFNPLKATPVKLPTGGVFVISNSFYQAPKAVTAATGYNLRVVEGRLGAKLIAKAHGLANFLEFTSLYDLQQALGNKSLQEMQEVARAALHSEPYTTAELEELLGVEMTQEKLFADRPAAALVLETKLEKVGQLMSESHASCDGLYECSCEKLNELVTLAM